MTVAAEVSLNLQTESPSKTSISLLSQNTTVQPQVWTKDIIGPRAVQQWVPEPWHVPPQPQHLFMQLPNHYVEKSHETSTDAGRASFKLFLYKNNEYIIKQRPINAWLLSIWGSLHSWLQQYTKKTAQIFNLHRGSAISSRELCSNF